MSRRNATFWPKIGETGVGEMGVGEQGPIRNSTLFLHIHNNNFMHVAIN